MSEVSFQLTGIESLLAKLNEITYDVKRKGGRSSLRKAAMLVAKAAQSNIISQQIDDPKTPRDIGKNITVRWSPRRFKNSGDLGFRIGVLGGAKRPAIAAGEFKGAGKSNPGGDTWYWRFQEFGSEKNRARPFMRPALEKNTDKATNVFILEYGKAIDRAIKRASKMGERSTRG